MTSTSQNIERDVGECMASGHMKRFYESVNRAMTISEVKPGTYQYSYINPSSGVSALKEGSKTDFKFQADRFQVISIENSNILMKQEFSLSIPKPDPDCVIKKYFVGYTDAAYSIKHYTIYSNSDKVIVVQPADYEWFLNSICINDSANDGNPSNSTLNKIRRQDPELSGIIIDVSGLTATTSIKIKIDVRVPLSKFCVFRELKWLFEHMGPLKVEVFPTASNLVVAPVLSDDIFEKYPGIQELVNSINNKADHPLGASQKELQKFDLGYYQLNQRMRNLFKITTATTVNSITHTVTEIDHANNTWGWKDSITSEMQLELAYFEIREDIANEIREEYTESPLLFPIQVVNWTDFSGQLGTNKDISLSCKTEIKCVETAFILFKEDNATSTVRFPNPYIDYHVIIGGKYYPLARQQTSYDHKQTNQVLDAFNLNNSKITSLSRDVRTSLQSFTEIYEYRGTSGEPIKTYKWTTGDQSKFFIPLVFCESHIFQGGLNLGDTQVVLKASRLDNGKVPTKLSRIHYDQPVFVTISDRIMIIQTSKPSGGPQWEITDATYDELLGVA